ncbi:hypothetical protein AAG570_008444 [Ranatra chinensis]|uniref:Endocuticle structural glycoprotein SgAbd-2 n=1 Tax=Ranatra chinensis TaxID=642074 RepID=A0ABD0YQX6_9HEMI
MAAPQFHQVTRKVLHAPQLRFVPNARHPSAYLYNPEPFYVPTHRAVQPIVPHLQRPIAILRHAADTNTDGSFFYDFDTENGISAKSSGHVKNLGTKDEIQVMQGSYSYTGPDGIPITTNWVADEFGFRAEGAHLPVPPPIPEEIARSIEYNRAHPQPVGVEAA